LARRYRGGRFFPTSGSRQDAKIFGNDMIRAMLFDGNDTRTALVGRRHYCDAMWAI
jgi:hypothetical protein